MGIHGRKVVGSVKRKRNRGKKRLNGYFTVEAALILPVAIGVYLFLIYSMFFQYNRCLLEQDASSLVVRAVQDTQEDPAQMIDKVKQQETLLELKRYMAFSKEESVFECKGGKVRIEKKGKTKAPFLSFLSLSEQGRFHCTAEIQARRMDPCMMIRLLRKTINYWEEKKEDAEDGICKEPAL